MSESKVLCPYCHEDFDGYITPLEKNGHAFISYNARYAEIHLKAKGWHGYFKINFCPMCGRKLIRGEQE